MSKPHTRSLLGIILSFSLNIEIIYSLDSLKETERLTRSKAVMTDNTEQSLIKTEHLLPILNGKNYPSWYGQMKVQLRGKDLWLVCITPLAEGATATITAENSTASDKAISIIVPRLSQQCYNEYVNSTTIDSAYLLWKKIADQHASRTVINQGCFYTDHSTSNRIVSRILELIRFESNNAG
ncbi:hypothetical protein PGTUg99_005694 [Puccinia graminis f. sp. tritici]|uniref:DUF4219 domain-containing protein n=1 Tax=Puccinia graminis f. sp. tritici TaxID=56615 RepID=A0A5B0RK93_PUCGR|nr:hypothetical protein PGTUg99_005694 [Puccinia graminis f. sp. tritici]